MEKKQRFDEKSTCFDVSLPAWAIAALNDLPEYLSTHEERIQVSNHQVFFMFSLCCRGF